MGGLGKKLSKEEQRKRGWHRSGAGDAISYGCKDMGIMTNDAKE